nr:dymeclin isoform X2 [Ipomoea batatas]
MGGVPSTPRFTGAVRQETAEYLIGAFIGDKSYPLTSDYWQKLLLHPLYLHWSTDRVHKACRLFDQRIEHLVVHSVFSFVGKVDESSLVNMVVQKLLHNYITRPRFPAKSLSYQIFAEGNQPGGLQRVGSVAANLVLLPLSYFASSSAEASKSPLADSSLNILLILTHYRKCLNVDPGKDETVWSDGYFTFRCWLMRLLFSFFIHIVHGNSDFLEYVLVRTDLDTLLMPLLETLYNAPRRAPNQIYMVLIILLILSQDSSFNASIHKLMLQSVPWYKERVLHQTSLGSLMVIILTRIINYNLSKLRDVYLHTNCLATLANMAPHVHRLSAYASQRLVSLFDMLSRKYNKLAEMKNDKMSFSNGESIGDNLPEDSSAELHIYTDFLRIVLEILNAILTYALPRNPEVVYAILHRQEVFHPFKSHPRFNELLDNLFTVLDFFNSRMDAQNIVGEWSVEKVLQIIIVNCRSWRGEGMKMFTQMRFTYEQESHPEEFFIPYVWQLVLSRRMDLLVQMQASYKMANWMEVDMSESGLNDCGPLNSEIFKNSSEINRSSGTNTLGVLSSLEESSDPADRELEPRLRRSRHRFCGFRLASTSAALPCTPAATHFQLRNPN